MIHVHDVPEIYNPDVPFSVKCQIVNQLCSALAEYRGITRHEMRSDLMKTINVDFESLLDNEVGLLLLYEYIYAMRPVACYARKNVSITQS